MFHPKAIFRIVGILLLFEAIFLLSGVLVALYYDEAVIDQLFEVPCILWYRR